ncbi:14700_t:CDS:2 [Dentiscutata heterogama]|uniref:14700_t:CDS:1 n=1 Tax=Dentiscutata heterogama TaxID=1316150 RepID=A0ACA9KHY6_9GLOM|nr:14700_t:CDS:2 [Dentiscutata heterogama]
MAQRCEHREWLDNAIRNNQIIKYHYNTFNDITPIGHGTFGKVSSAISSEVRRKVALKSIKINPDFTIELLVNELKQHIRIGSHNNILEFYGVIEGEPSEFILVLEYANNGTLREYLCDNFYILNWDDKLCLAKQLADAIKFLHSYDIIHRDLHSENVLIHDKIIKLSDFGNSKFVADPSIQLTKGFGSIRYSDPEFVRSSLNYSRTKKSDIYSLGVLLWEISSGREPFKFDSLPNLLSHIISGLKENPINGTPKDYVNIYEECWKSVPDQRPTIEEIVKPDITSIDSKIFHELCEVLSSTSNSALNINEALNLASNINETSISASNFDEEPIIKIDTKTLEYIDNNIKDPDKQFLRKLVQLFLHVSEEPKLLINQIEALIEDYDENPDRIFKKLLKHQGQPTFAHLIGFFYENGFGVKVNKQKAHKIFCI